MCLITRFGPPLKCLLGRIRPQYYMAKMFGDVIPYKICYLNFDPFHRRMFHHHEHNCERLAYVYYVVKRFKYSKKEDNSDSEDEDELETIEDVGKDFKILKLRVNSLRTDLILKAALGMARNKVETAFFQSKVRINGAIPTKKSAQLKVEDEVDLVRGTSKLNPGFLIVSRIKVLSYSEREDKYTVNAQCFRALTIENYSDHPLKENE